MEGVETVRKCKHCGFLTRTRRKLRQHMVVCKHGQSETRPPEGRETEEELVEAQVSEEPVEAEVEEIADEGIDYNDMNVIELRRLARVEGITGIYGKNKAELIEALKVGEK